MSFPSRLPPAMPEAKEEKIRTATQKLMIIPESPEGLRQSGKAIITGLWDKSIRERMNIIFDIIPYIAPFIPS